MADSEGNQAEIWETRDGLRLCMRHCKDRSGLEGKVGLAERLGLSLAVTAHPATCRRI